MNLLEGGLYNRSLEPLKTQSLSQIKTQLRVGLLKLLERTR